MLAAETIADRGLDMLAQLQIAHYVDGCRIAERAVLIEVAAALGLDPAAFAEALDRQSGEAVQAHISETRAFMAQVGAQGFPTFVLETTEGLQIEDFTGYLGRPQDFRTGCAVRRAHLWLPAQPKRLVVTPMAVPSESMPRCTTPSQNPACPSENLDA